MNSKMQDPRDERTAVCIDRVLKLGEPKTQVEEAELRALLIELDEWFTKELRSGRQDELLHFAMDTLLVYSKWAP